jgi:hypothetical protein
LFNISKNISRQGVEIFENNVFPKFPEIKYETEIKNNLDINTVKEGDSIQSRVCWNTPFLCRTNDNFVLKTINSYIFIKKK